MDKNRILSKAATSLLSTAKKKLFSYSHFVSSALDLATLRSLVPKFLKFSSVYTPDEIVIVYYIKVVLKCRVIIINGFILTPMLS